MEKSTSVSLVENQIIGITNEEIVESKEYLTSIQLRVLPPVQFIGVMQAIKVAEGVQVSDPKKHILPAPFFINGAHDFFFGLGAAAALFDKYPSVKFANSLLVTALTEAAIFVNSPAKPLSFCLNAAKRYTGSYLDIESRIHYWLRKKSIRPFSISSRFTVKKTHSGLTLEVTKL